MKIYGFIISTIFLLNYSTQAQLREKRDWRPSDIYFSADALSLVKSLNGGKNQFDFQIKTDFDQFYLALDVGRYTNASQGDDFKYSGQGNFLRYGPQVNLMPYNPKRASLYFGIMQGRAFFNDNLESFIQSNDGWGTVELPTSQNKNLRATWYEMHMGLNVVIAGPLNMGYNLRFRFAQQISGNDFLIPFEIPGYGRSDKQSLFALNYYITYRLNFRNKPIPKRPIVIPPNAAENQKAQTKPKR